MRKLIFTDENAIQKEVELRHQLNDAITVFIALLENKGIEFKKEYAIAFIENGIPFIKALLLKYAQQEIKRLKITSLIVQKNMINGTDEQAEIFKDILAQISLKLSECNINISEIDFHEKKAVLLDSEIETIKEKHSIYLETEQQEKIWNLQNEFAKALNNLENGLKDSGLPSLVRYGKLEGFDEYMKCKSLLKIDKLESSMEKLSGFSKNGNTIIEANPEIFR